jgi:hypothetical protein
LKTISDFTGERMELPAQEAGLRPHAAFDFVLFRALTLTRRITKSADARFSVRKAECSDLFDTLTDSHYSTRACRSAVEENRAPAKPLNGPIIHARALSLLLSLQPGAGVFSRLNSEDRSTGMPRTCRANKRCGFFVFVRCIEFT